MSRRTLALSAVVMILMAMVTAETLAATTCGEPAPAAKFQVGDKWTWRDERGQESTDEVVQVDGDFTQIRWNNGDVAFLDKDRVLQKVRRKNGEVVTQQGAGAYVMVGKRIWEFPLQVGKKWSLSYTGNASSGTYAMLIYNQHYEVVACEEVATPAGKFAAFKVQVDQNAVGIPGSGTYYSWYAPEVKVSVKRQYVPSQYWSKTFNTELIKYECK